ncbi:helix-turn-helix domain-containing protein [Streptomyces lavendulocolor]|uniref:helix-turn-helix domain-containing protein n=1 Tax=Streptomyces lavendulocolor TaxID=67316 RepID=UPI0033E359A1
MQHPRRFLYQSDGVRLTPQTRPERHLSGSEREEISRGIAVGESARQLAKRLGRSPAPPHRHRGGRRGPGAPGCPRHAGQGRRLPPRHRAGRR